MMLHRAAKPLLWAVGLSPPLWLLALAGLMDAGAKSSGAPDPRPGRVSQLRWLWLCLAIRPAARTTGLVSLAHFRRMLGLLAAGTMPRCTCWPAAGSLELGLDWAELWRDTLKQPFIFVGMCWPGSADAAAGFHVRGPRRRPDHGRARVEAPAPPGLPGGPGRRCCARVDAGASCASVSLPLWRPAGAAAGLAGGEAWKVRRPAR